MARLRWWGFPYGRSFGKVAFLDISVQSCYNKISHSMEQGETMMNGEDVFSTIIILIWTLTFGILILIELLPGLIRS